MKVQKVRFTYTYDDSAECPGHKETLGHEIGVIIPAEKDKYPEILWVKQYPGREAELYILKSENKDGDLKYLRVKGYSFSTSECPENRNSIELLEEFKVEYEIAKAIRDYALIRYSYNKANAVICKLVFPNGK